MHIKIRICAIRRVHVRGCWRPPGLADVSTITSCRRGGVSCQTDDLSNERKKKKTQQSNSKCRAVTSVSFDFFQVSFSLLLIHSATLCSPLFFDSLTHCRQLRVQREHCYRNNWLTRLTIYWPVKGGLRQTIHPRLQLQTGKFSEGWDDEREDQSQANKHGRQDHLVGWWHNFKSN